MITFSYTELHREDTEGHRVKKPDLCGPQCKLLNTFKVDQIHKTWIYICNGIKLQNNLQKYI